LFPACKYFYTPLIDYEKYPIVLDGQLRAINERRATYVVFYSNSGEAPQDNGSNGIADKIIKAINENYVLMDIAPGTSSGDFPYYCLYKKISLS
jgi:hypothetical protein